MSLFYNESSQALPELTISLALTPLCFSSIKLKIIIYIYGRYVYSKTRDNFKGTYYSMH